METFAKLYSQFLFFPGHQKKILFLEISQPLGVSESPAKQNTKRDLEGISATKALGQLNIPKQGSFQFQRLIDQIGASLWQ